MSQRDLTAELRAARIDAPPELRERVRLIAAADTTPARRRTFTWRRALVVALPVAAAVAAAIVFTRPAHNTQTPVPVPLATAVEHGAAATAPKRAAIAPAPSTTRVQRYGASLTLRVPTADGVSRGVKSALAIVKSLGGYASSVHATTSGKSGSAELTLKVPRAHIQEAIARLSGLGTITAEQVDVQDLQASLDATGRTIARLQRQLAVLRAKPQTDALDAQIAALVARIERLQRAQAETTRSARYATVSLKLATPAPVVSAPHHGALHGLRVALVWLGIALLYVLALGTPLVILALVALLIVRTVRRRREDALLSRS
jgi:hypothetical protein